MQIYVFYLCVATYILGIFVHVCVCMRACLHRCVFVCVFVCMYACNYTTRHTYAIHCKLSIILLNLFVVSCPNLSQPENGLINCSLGDDGVISYEDTCSFICSTGYELTGSDTRTCQSDGSWSGSYDVCRRGNYTHVGIYVQQAVDI